MAARLNGVQKVESSNLSAPSMPIEVVSAESREQPFGRLRAGARGWFSLFSVAPTAKRVERA